MANAIASTSIDGGKTGIADVQIETTLSIDTYAAGGVDLLALLANDSTFQASKYKTADIKDAIVQCGVDAESVKHMARYNKATGRVHLFGPNSASADFAERTGNPAAPVTINCTLFLR